MSDKIPISRDQLEDDLRQMTAVMVGIVGALFHFPKAMRDQFLGVKIDEEAWSPGFYTDGIDDGDIARFNVEQHPFVAIVRHAYDYAYQVEGAHDFDLEVLWYEVAPVREQLPAQDINGLPTPMNYVDGRIRKVLDTFEARYDLNSGKSLSVEQLALLANMSPATVRTSLNKEGLRLVDPTPKGPGVISLDPSEEWGTRPSGYEKKGPKRNQLGNPEALDWLSRRRSFIPNKQVATGVDWKTAAKNAFAEDVSNFPAVLKRIVKLSGISRPEIAAAVQKSEDWVDGLIGGERVEIDIAALVRFAGLVQVPPARFASQAVAHLLETADQTLESMDQ